jgi:ABC-type transport system substrate-binding protein
VLKDVPFGEWRTHPFTTGAETYTVKKLDGTQYTAHGPIGTGPYICDGYDPVTKCASYHRWDDWWGWKYIQRAGNIKYLKHIQIEKTDSAISALKSGELDVISSTGYSIEKRVAEIGTFAKVLRCPSFSLSEVVLNLGNDIFGTGKATPLGRTDPSRAQEAAVHVRKALSYAIPRQKIIDMYYPDVASLGGSPLTPTMPGYVDIPVDPYNLTLAKQELMKAGYEYPAEEGAQRQLIPTEYYIGIAIAVVVIIGICVYAIKKRKKRK